MLITLDQLKTSLSAVKSFIANKFVAKDSIDNAGITDRTYTTLFGGQFSVTTATNASYINPHARASVTGRISKHYIYRVTVNDTEYILPCRLWCAKIGYGLKTYEYIGNLSLYVSDISGVPGDIDNVPFIIISDLNDASSIDVLTSSAGTYNILVERIDNTQTELPKSLIYGDSYEPVVKKNNSGTYNGYSLGVNTLSNTRGTFALGYGNTVSQDFGIAFGIGNEVSGKYGTASGEHNTVSGESALVEGFNNTASGDYSHAEGSETEASKQCAHSEGYQSIASGNAAHAEGIATTASGNFSHAEGNSNVASAHSSHAEGVSTIAASSGQHTQGKFNVEDSNDTYAHIIGGGTGMDNRANIQAIDWNGNEYLAGDVYVNCDSDSTNGSKLISDADYATQTTGGIVKVATSGYYGIQMGNTNNQMIMTYPAESGDIKNGTTPYKPIGPAAQHEATFYGLAKATGDTTQSTSSNAVGVYTDTAKTKIKEMLGVEKTVAVSGTSPTITAEANARYICGEVTSLSFTPCASGICDVQFTSGSTVTVLTVPSTVKFPDWFDPTSLKTNTVYEINILDGIYGVVMKWAA